MYVALGTIISDPDFFHCCVRAFADQPYHVVMSVGRGAIRPPSGRLPRTIEAHRSVPQTAVLAHAFVTRTGMNSTMEALAAGVPMLALPHTPEARTTADRIVERGLGHTLAPAEATADRLRSVVADLLGDASGMAELRIRHHRQGRCRGRASAPWRRRPTPVPPALALPFQSAPLRGPNACVLSVGAPSWRSWGRNQ
ncbi:hypothetical protein MQV74_38240 [Streptomyces sp. AN091965]|nr:hypothetical protein [Streptomyces sp. AN091965]